MIWLKCHISIYAVSAIRDVTFCNTGPGHNLSLAHCLQITIHLYAQFTLVFKCTPLVIMLQWVWRSNLFCLLKVFTFFLSAALSKKAWPFPHSWTCTRCWPLVRKLCMLAEDVLALSPWEGHAWKHFRFYTSHLNTWCCNITWDSNTTPTNSQDFRRTGEKKRDMLFSYSSEVGKTTSVVKGQSAGQWEEIVLLGLLLTRVWSQTH